MSDRRAVLLKVSANLVRAADLEMGSEFATRIALTKVRMAQVDLNTIARSLEHRLVAIGPPAPPEVSP